MILAIKAACVGFTSVQFLCRDWLFIQRQRSKSSGSCVDWQQMADFGSRLSSPVSFLCVSPLFLFRLCSRHLQQCLWVYEHQISASASQKNPKNQTWGWRGNTCTYCVSFDLEEWKMISRVQDVVFCQPSMPHHSAFSTRLDIWVKCRLENPHFPQKLYVSFVTCSVEIFWQHLHLFAV